MEAGIFRSGGGGGWHMHGNETNITVSKCTNYAVPQPFALNLLEMPAYMSQQPCCK